MASKKIFALIMSLFIGIFALYTVAMYLYDPMHIISNKEQLFNGSMRYQARGYLENKNVKGLIIGTSMLENTSSDEATAKLFKHGSADRFINISLAGSTLADRKVVLDYAFKHNEIKKVIYSLEMSPLFYQDLAPMNWQKIYDDNPLSVMSPYLKTGYVKCLLTFSKSEKCVGVQKSLDRPASWIDDPLYKDSFNGVCSWNEVSRNILKSYLDTNGKSNELKLYGLDYLKQYTKQQLFSIIDAKKDTEFYLVIPPSSAIYYKLQTLYYKEHIALIKNFITYLADACSQRENCTLYGFDDTGLSLDLKNYKDMFHYLDKINSLMIDSIEKQEHVLTSENVQSYFFRMDEIIEKADVDAVKTEIRQCK